MNRSPKAGVKEILVDGNFPPGCSWKRALLGWELEGQWKKEANTYSATPPALPHRLTRQDPLMEKPRKHKIEARGPSDRNQILRPPPTSCSIGKPKIPSFPSA
ncbi:hypothetical protein F2Q70_00002856 [Brassica cretica]|uniref:Uncharacterized protein n=1 Tax=Brassica cretica TaxID=69181 RepID=A0A8S9INA3_BRACR|nr:hypothetical protein F2Q70_00002856 [Brassica cretica]